jgi:hypothetical protein
MLGIPLRYLLSHPVSAVADIAADPLEIWTTIHDAYVAEREQRGPQCQYEADGNWEQRLHEALGVPWPCNATSEFWDLWPKIISELDAKGIRAGPESFQWWNDGDAGLVRAIWCVTRHLRPKQIVETGVAHGVTSRCILEALTRSRDGRLWSTDLPPLERDWRKQVGVAVGDRFSKRQTIGTKPSPGSLQLCFRDSLESLTPLAKTHGVLSDSAQATFLEMFEEAAPARPPSLLRPFAVPRPRCGRSRRCVAR